MSIVTAVYNRSNTIADALHSLRGQDYPREHVVQDGGSTDGTLDIIHNLADENTRLESARDDGIYDAINKGIARASGDVIGLLHSDDFFAHDHVLSRVAETFASSDVDGVYGDLEYVDQKDTSRVIRYWQAGEYRPALLRRGWMPPHPTLFLRREVFEQHGAYDTSFRISADYEAILRWLSRGEMKLSYVPEVLVKMRVGGESNRSLNHILKKSVEDYRALRCNGLGGLGVLAAKNLLKLPQLLRRASDQSKGL